MLVVMLEAKRRKSQSVSERVTYHVKPHMRAVAPATRGESPVERTSVRDQVSRLLRARIASGTLLPGEIYSAVALAEDLGVSATPIREAMIDLANAGLVEAVRNRGFRILEVSDRDLDEIVELRLMLEVPPLERIVAEASDEQLAALEPVLAPIARSARDGDLPGFLLSDSTFHLELLRLGGNERLVALVSELRDQTRLLGLRRLDESGDLERNAMEHREILDAVRSRELERAQILMIRHLRHARGIWAGRSEPDG
jgi:DNA-binding GntR family transcriptional regulator